MKSRFYLIVGAIILLVIIIIAASAGSPSANKPHVGGQTSVTVNRAIGLEYIIIDNLSTDESNIKTMLTLPYTFNCSTGDFLQFAVITKDGFSWDAWEFTDGTFDHHNPMQLSADHDLVITPNCIRVAPLTTPSPTPTPSPKPVE